MLHGLFMGFLSSCDRVLAMCHTMLDTGLCKYYAGSHKFHVGSHRYVTGSRKFVGEYGMFSAFIRLQYIHRILDMSYISSQRCPIKT